MEMLSDESTLWSHQWISKNLKDSHWTTVLKWEHYLFVLLVLQWWSGVERVPFTLHDFSTWKNQIHVCIVIPVIFVFVLYYVNLVFVCFVILIVCFFHVQNSKKLFKKKRIFTSSFADKLYVANPIIPLFHSFPKSTKTVSLLPCDPWLWWQKYQVFFMIQGIPLQKFRMLPGPHNSHG